MCYLFLKKGKNHRALWTLPTDHLASNGPGNSTPDPQLSSLPKFNFLTHKHFMEL